MKNCKISRLPIWFYKYMYTGIGSIVVLSHSCISGNITYLGSFKIHLTISINLNRNRVFRINLKNISLSGCEVSVKINLYIRISIKQFDYHVYWRLYIGSSNGLLLSRLDWRLFYYFFLVNQSPKKAAVKFLVQPPNELRSIYSTIYSIKFSVKLTIRFALSGYFQIW